MDEMIGWLALPLFALLMLAYTLGAAGLLYRFLSSPPVARAPDALAFGLALSPFVAGLLTIALLIALGPRPDANYVFLHFGIAGTLMLLSHRPIADMVRQLSWSLRSAAAQAPSLWRVVFRIETVLAIVLLAQLAGLAAQVLFVPLVENDALEYANVGKVLYERRTPDAYPLVEADPRTGMYAPWTHPPLYVALIFLAYLLQGTPETPGLMRLIAPYCLFVALVLLARVAIATQGERRWSVALLAGILVLATPLLRRMVGGASIDALPILGMTMVFAALCLCAEAPLMKRIALTGAALGLSLWSHSLAILFPFLALACTVAMRWSQRRPMVAESAAMLALGAAIGGLPYLRNWMIFGSPISDNPPVFALEALDFNSYFTTGRGLGNTYNLIVLGVLRGWTDYPEFWIDFWLMAAGMVLLSGKLIRRRVPVSDATAILLGAAAIVATYHAGMLLSVLIGGNQMVRNGRYLLPMVPLAALLGAFAVVLTFSQGLWLASRQAIRRNKLEVKRIGHQLMISLNIDWRDIAAGIGLLGLVLYLALPPALSSFSYDLQRLSFGQLRYQFGLFRAGRVDEESLQTYPFYRVLSYMKKTLPDNAVVLSLRPADMYYAKHRMISYMDPRLVPAYLAPDSERMAAELARLGVTHVYRQNYSIPPLYNSALMPLLADTRLSRLLHSDGHYAVFALGAAATAPDPARAALPPIQTWDIAPRDYPWTGSAGLVSGALAGFCSTVNIPVVSSEPQPTVRACRFMPEHRAIYISGAGNAIQVEEKPETFLKLPSATLYRYTAKVSGRGYIRMLIYGRQSTWVSAYLMDEGTLTMAGKSFTRIFQIPHNIVHVRMGIWVEGAGEIRIHDFKLEALRSPD